MGNWLTSLAYNFFIFQLTESYLRLTYFFRLILGHVAIVQLNALLGQNTKHFDELYLIFEHESILKFGTKTNISEFQKSYISILCRSLIMDTIQLLIIENFFENNIYCLIFFKIIKSSNSKHETFW